MPLVAVLDACVLYSFSTRDILLRLAEAGAFRAVWSEGILAELERSLDGSQAANGSRVRQLLELHFEDALALGVHRHLPKVPIAVHPKARHVVAAALSARADVIVTFNTRDFPWAPLKDVELTVQHPDEFLLEQLASNQEVTLQALRDQADQLRNPPMSMEALRLHVPAFAEAASGLLRISE